MKKLFICLSVLIFVTLAQAQFKFEITQEFKKGEGEITITGKSADEIWKGVSQTLTRLKYKIMETDKDEGLIIAWIIEDADVYANKEVRTDSVKVKIITGEWKITIESIEETVIVVCSYEGEGAGFWGSKKKSFENFCTKLKNILER